jgi:geranylgeranyl pyrophosphate synthase
MKQVDTKPPSQEELMKQIRNLLIERGSTALEIARNQVLQQPIECAEAQAALKYFMTEYWRDVARPALLSMACEAVGGDPSLTTPIAVPMILISGAIDIHDDIIDESETKGDRPTVFGKFGKDIALLVGDALLLKGFASLHESLRRITPLERATDILNIINEAFYELGDAEALELQFRRRIDITPETYLHVLRKKAADVEAHTRISGILGNGSKDDIEALGQYGRLLGMIIILRDDFIDALDLNEALHRIQKECLPLPLLYALQKPNTGSVLAHMLSQEEMTREHVEKILELTDTAEGFKRVEELLTQLGEEACSYTKRFKTRGALLRRLVRCYSSIS